MPVLLTRPQSRREPETDEEARDRALDMLREMAELSMRAARVATDRIEANQSDPDSAEPTPSLTLVRATHAARQAIALEHRLRTGIAAPAPTARAPAARSAYPLPAATRDPRRPLLRDALRKAAQSEPDRAVRTRLCRFIDERVDAELSDDPDAAIPVVELLIALSEEIGLPIDVSKLSSELLGIPPSRRPTPGSDPFLPSSDTG